MIELLQIGSAFRVVYVTYVIIRVLQLYKSSKKSNIVEKHILMMMTSYWISSLTFASYCFIHLNYYVLHFTLMLAITAYLIGDYGLFLILYTTCKKFKK